MSEVDKCKHGMPLDVPCFDCDEAREQVEQVLYAKQPMTTPSDPSAELASLAEASVELAKTPTTTSLATFWRQLAQKSIAVASRLESDLRATREKLRLSEAKAKSWESTCRVQSKAKLPCGHPSDYAYDKGGPEKPAWTVFGCIGCEHQTLRAQNLALEGQVGELRKHLSIVDRTAPRTDGFTEEGSDLFHLSLQLSAKELIELRKALSRTPETALGEIREIAKRNTPDSYGGFEPNVIEEIVTIALNELLTTLTGEKK